MTEHNPDALSASPALAAAPAGAARATPRPPGELATFREKVEAGRFVITVEVDPPHGLSARRAIQGAQLLREAGVDAINVGDSPTAKVRMSPLAMSVLLQREVGVDIVMHYTTRDRNAMAIHSDMVGAHVLGIRSILCLRGDPPSVGGYTDIVGVWDVSAVGLMRFLKLANDGVDFTGKSIGRQASFFIGGSANLNADPLETELRLMRRKVEAGAHFFMTQNVFDAKVLERFLDKAAKFGRPIIVGVLPLHNSRHAEFLHSQVPGMSLPDGVRERMRRAGEERGPAEGAAMARDMIAVCREKAAGVYLVPSFGRYDLAAELVAETKSAASS
ncbi:MAG: methylenetetrahydrofolate reductase [Dehalococcoidia bacterium]|nr:methylenetetrahydrofolate reductase [Dehalococcoidia bacterium]